MKRLTLLCSVAFVMFSHLVTAQTTSINGLVALVKYSDYKTTATKTQIENLLNQETGFNLWGNGTSVREFYKIQSNNKVVLNSTVVVVQLNQTSDYYLGNHPDYDGPQRLVNDVVAAIKTQVPAGFTGLSKHPTVNRMWNFSILSYSGPNVGNNSAFPVALEQYITVDGIPMRIGHVAIVCGSQDGIHVGDITHEYGHLIMDWTDYYHVEFSDVGDYDMIGTGGTFQSGFNVNPGLRYKKGWITDVVDITGTTTQTYTLTANSYTQIHKYANPNNPKEYLLFHGLKHNLYYQAFTKDGQAMPEGLAIWYVDEEAGYDTPNQRSDLLVRLVQADNLDEMHDLDAPADDLHGDLEDLYGNTNTSFPNGHPLKWKDGGDLGISLSNITIGSTTISFTVNGRPGTVIASSDIYGTISPKGTISATAGSGKTFTFTPNPGYQLNTLIVNGVSVTPTNPYTLSNITGTTTLRATFKRLTTVPALPSPWQKTNLVAVSSGFAAQTSGKFYLESSGGSMAVNDSATFVYQTITGNGSIIARLAGYDKASNHTKTGIMMRASLQANAVQSMIAKIPFEGIEVQQRSSTGNSLAGDPNNIGGKERYNLYSWMKISRSGNVITSYCSRDGIIWIPIANQTLILPSQIYVGMYVSGANGTFPAQAFFDNVSIAPVASSCAVTGTKVNGTVISNTNGSYGNSGNTKEKVFDNDIFSFFDADFDLSWVGLDLPQAVKVTGIRFIPRQALASRMINGKFEGSNTADFASPVLLAAITNEPSYDWNCIPVSNTSNFKYLRYTGLSGTACNVAEIEFYGITSIPPAVAITSPANNATFASGASITISANASDADGTIAKVDFYNGTTLLYSDPTSPYSYVWPNVGTGTYSITAKATDNSSLVTTSSAISVTVGTPSTDICFEAESGLGQSTFAPFQVMNDVNASGGKYIVVPNGTGTQGSPPANSIATFSFSLSSTATYYFWVRILAPTSNDNNMYIRTDQSSYTTFTPGTSTSWAWKKWTSKSMSAGNHTISIARNRDGLQIDKIFITKSSSTPSEAGCGAQLREEVQDIEMDNVIENQLLLSPNPSSNTFSISTSGKAISYLSVCNTLGVVVFTASDIEKGTRTEFGNSFENGVYNVTLKYEDGKSESVKIVKMR